MGLIFSQANINTSFDQLQLRRSISDIQSSLKEKKDLLIKQSEQINQILSQIQSSKLDAQNLVTGFKTFLRNQVNEQIKKLLQKASYYQKLVDDWFQKFNQDIDSFPKQWEQLKVLVISENLSQVAKIVQDFEGLLQDNQRRERALEKLKNIDFSKNVISQSNLCLNIYQELKALQKDLLGETFIQNEFDIMLFSYGKSSCKVVQYEVPFNQTNVNTIETRNFQQHHRAIQVSDNSLVVSSGQNQQQRLTLINFPDAKDFNSIYRRYSHGIAQEAGKYVYLIAGTQSNRFCEIFNLEDQKFTRIADYPIYAFSHSCAMMNGLLYSFGGKNKDLNQFSDQVFSYSSQLNKWETQRNLPHSTKTLSVGLQENSILVFSNENKLKGVYSFDGRSIDEYAEDYKKGFCYNVPQQFEQRVYFYNEIAKMYTFDIKSKAWQQL